ncbi:hypothetical protein B0H11DRAFT_1904055 [Mycena galericulata]|nr:hypothetical protein B0H11DRAFT_1904055 [Mycena galericulata]
MGIASGFLCAYTILLVLNILLVQQPQLFAFLGQRSPGCRFVIHITVSGEVKTQEETSKNYQRRLLTRKGERRGEKQLTFIHLSSDPGEDRKDLRAKTYLHMVNATCV